MMALIRRGMLQGRYHIASVLGPVFQVVFFAFIISLSVEIIPGGHIAPIDFIMPGLVLLAGMQVSYEGKAYGIMELKMNGSITDYFTSPLRPSEIYTSWMLSEVPEGLTICFLCWLVLLPLGIGVPIDAVTAIIALLVGILISASFGIVMTLTSRHWDGVSSGETFVMIPIIFLSGTFFGIDQIPGDYQWLLQYNPLYHVIATFREAMLYGTASISALLPALGLLVLLVGTGIY
ncbi:MAG: ABC transporter permease, partial [Pseudomonadota bacterium]